MIELVIVVILIAVIGGMVVPRVVRSERRIAERECEDVRRILSIAASRSALAGQDVLVRYDSRERIVRAYVLTEVVSRGVARNEWTQDRLILPVKLESLAFRRGMADTQGLASAGWSIEFSTGQPRPLVWLAFSAASEPESLGWQIELLPEETGASRRRMSEASRASGAGLYRVDLDATNQGERAW